MTIKSLSLKNFRNFESLELNFSPTKTLIVGPNGAGKSNVLEAIYLLASGVSRRAEREEEMVRFGLDFAKIIGTVAEGAEELSLDLTLNVSAKLLSKVGKINGVKKPLGQFLGGFKAVEFAPEDINLVTGPPESRRRYLNSVLNQASREYRDSFHSFERARKQKNSILFQINNGTAKADELDLWNGKLLEFGPIVNKKRNDYLNYLSDNREGVSFRYLPSELSEERLNLFREREIAAGVSLIGPHRDDFEFVAKGTKAKGLPEGKSLAAFGSRGQQRLAVFELKLGELRYFRQNLKVEPILLLDDIFSELDKNHRQEVLEKLSPLASLGQVVFTATAASVVGRENLAGMKVTFL